MHCGICFKNAYDLVVSNSDILYYSYANYIP